MEEFLAGSFKTIFDHINFDGVKAEVDLVGLDRFIEDCARYAGITGAVTGIGGAATFMVGVPASIANNVAQQFRVTLAYLHTQDPDAPAPAFDDFMKIVGRSLGLDISASASNTIMITIAHTILARLGAAGAGALFPIIGAVIGGSLSYNFIWGIGKSLKAMDMAKTTPPAKPSKGRAKAAA